MVSCWALKKTSDPIYCLMCLAAFDNILPQDLDFEDLLSWILPDESTLYLGALNGRFP